jgi:hypothetical protein
MKKSLAKNPNMLRTMIGTGMVLVLILSYAVYSNTLDSEYYGYKTSNESETIDLQTNEEDSANWYFTSREAITWINVTIEGVQSDTSKLIIEASGVEWYYSPLLGIDDADFFNCEDGGFSETSESCSKASVHEIIIDTNKEQIIHGRVSLNLPIEGLGFIQSDTQYLAEEEARRIVDDEKKTITWNMKLEENGEILSDENITINVDIVKHEFISVEEFKLNPIQESIYSLATLIGCFFLLLFIPLTVYFSALYKSKNDDKLRLEN